MKPFICYNCKQPLKIQAVRKHPPFTLSEFEKAVETNEFDCLTRGTNDIQLFVSCTCENPALSPLDLELLETNWGAPTKYITEELK